MNNRTLEDNPFYQAGKTHGEVLAKAFMQPASPRQYYMQENTVYINDRYIRFYIIAVSREQKKITVNIADNGHHSIDTFELFDLDGWTYFEYGRPVPEKIYLSDFMEAD